MAFPSCPKCSNRSFTLEELDGVAKSKYKFFAVCCSSCGAILSVQDYYPLGAMLEKVLKKLGIPF